MWGMQRTEETCICEGAAAGGCSWWGHTPLASHPLERMPYNEQEEETRIGYMIKELLTFKLKMIGNKYKIILKLNC